MFRDFVSSRRCQIVPPFDIDSQSPRHRSRHAVVSGHIRRQRWNTRVIYFCDRQTPRPFVHHNHRSRRQVSKALHAAGQ